MTTLKGIIRAVNPVILRKRVANT